MTRDNRSYQRYDIDMVLEVTGKNKQGLSFTEQACLLNISGGGALFTTTNLENFNLGQILETSIKLPGTHEIIGNMNTTAVVLRLEKNNPSDKVSGDKFLKVAVYFHKYLQLHCTYDCNK